MKQRKRLPSFGLKDGDAGEFGAVFSTLDVVDHDGDVTVPGAFKEGVEVIVGSWGHKTYELPTGKGVISADAKEARIDGAFFLDTTPGRDTYQTVKNLGDLGEWSYVYEATKVSFGERNNRPVRFLEEVRVYSVDPVLAGAGINTRTTDIKSLQRAIADGGVAGWLDELAELAGEYAECVKGGGGLFAKEGRVLSSANVERINEIRASARAIDSGLGSILADAEPKADEAVVRAYLESRKLLAGLV